MPTKSLWCSGIPCPRKKIIKKQALRVITFTLCLLLTFVLFACSPSGNGTPVSKASAEATVPEEAAAETSPVLTEPSDNPEVLRAIEYGFVPEKLMSSWDTPITFSEFTDIVKGVVSKLDASKVSLWDDCASKALNSHKEMIVGDAIAPLYYVASFLGYGTEPEGEWQNIANKYPQTDWSWLDGIPSWDLFPLTQESSPFIDDHDDYEPAGWDYYGAGYFWCLAQSSRVPGVAVLRGTDDELKETMTREVCVALVTRFYESILPVATTETNAQAQAILSDAAAWKSSFDATIPTAEYTGTAYYVANSGNDSNNGLTPETAWATVEKAVNAKLRPGDAILLNRGDSWYVNLSDKNGLTSDALILKSGVTLGSYGTGERPVLRGDAPDASDPTSWTLWYDQNGMKIWLFSRDMRDCNVIVFNGGESWADKIWPHWNGSDYVNADGSIFEPSVALKNDLTYCSLVDLSGKPLNFDIGNSNAKGPLYLRCDAGNPAEVYSEIAIPQVATGVILSTDAVATGLDLRYFTCIAATLDSYDGNSGMRLSSCEVSWCGGLISNYQESHAVAEGVYSPYGAGGAIQSSGTEISISDNFIHDCGPMSLIVSIHGDRPTTYTYANQLFTGNLIERCGAALHWANLVKMDNPDADGFISNLQFSNNMVLYSGSGWISSMISQTRSRMSAFNSSIEDMMGASNNDGIYITDNVFYLCDRPLIRYTDLLMGSDQNANAKPVFSGNTYAQYQYGWLAEWSDDLLALNEASVRDILGDQTGTIYEIN
jgi:hypothetical protein